MRSVPAPPWLRSITRKQVRATASGLRRLRNSGTHGQERHASHLGRVRRDRAVDHAGAIHSAAAPRRLLQSLATRHRIGPPARSALALFLELLLCNHYISKMRNTYCALRVIAARNRALGGRKTRKLMRCLQTRLGSRGSFNRGRSGQSHRLGGGSGMRRGLVSLGTDLMQEVNIEPAFRPVATCFRNVSSRSFNNLLLISLWIARARTLYKGRLTPRLRYS